jgi:hypothetical protein
MTLFQKNIRLSQPPRNYQGEHLAALHTRLINETRRLAQTSTPREIEARRVIVQGIEREIDWELGFCHLPIDAAIDEDELIAELFDPDMAERINHT